MIKTKKFVVGVDVGGTNVKCGLVDPQGRIIARSHLSTKKYHRQKSDLIDAIASAVQDLLKQAGVAKKNVSGLGLGLPGLIDVASGVVKLLPNIPGWKNVPLQRILQDKLHLRTVLENDVNLITLGEWRFGAGVGAQNMLCLTLGTGVGGGLILDGRLYRGEGFAAGELGHLPLNEQGPKCNCGGTGCFERYVGNEVLQRKAAKIFRDKTITLEQVSAMAAAGDIQALRFWEQTAQQIGNGLTGVVNVLNPRLIVIGGGVANSHKFIFPTIRQTIKKRAMIVQGQMFKIVKAKLGNDAGIIGARVLVEQGIS